MMYKVNIYFLLYSTLIILLFCSTNSSAQPLCCGSFGVNLYKKGKRLTPKKCRKENFYLVYRKRLDNTPTDTIPMEWENGSLVALLPISAHFDLVLKIRRKEMVIRFVYFGGNDESWAIDSLTFKEGNFLIIHDEVVEMGGLKTIKTGSLRGKIRLEQRWLRKEEGD